MNLFDCLGSQPPERVVQFRVKEGSDLLEGIEMAVAQADIRSGVIVSGLGALRKAVFRNLKWFPKSFPIKVEDRLYLDVEKPLELVSLGGWIAPQTNGVREVHAHFSASTVENGTVVTMGGHLTSGTICGIKVVVAILVLAGDGFYADMDAGTDSIDLFYKSEDRNAL